MARNASRLKLGYYPLVSAAAQRVRRLLEFPPECAVLDPCAGTGAALRQITGEAHTRRYGIELDSFRAVEASRILDEVVQGSVFDTHCAVESYSLLYLNPPYDDEIADGRNQRMERVFLEHCFRWLRPGGVLVLVIPGNRIASCSDVLAPHFRDLGIYRLTDPEAARYSKLPSSESAGPGAKESDCMTATYPRLGSSSST
jgi:SAM-dependent methyltransferase